MRGRASSSASSNRAGASSKKALSPAMDPSSMMESMRDARKKIADLEAELAAYKRMQVRWWMRSLSVLSAGIAQCAHSSHCLPHCCSHCSRVHTKLAVQQRAVYAGGWSGVEGGLLCWTAARRRRGVRRRGTVCVVDIVVVVLSSLSLLLLPS